MSKEKKVFECPTYEVVRREVDSNGFYKLHAGEKLGWENHRNGVIFMTVT